MYKNRTLEELLRKAQFPAIDINQFIDARITFQIIGKEELSAEKVISVNLKPGLLETEKLQLFLRLGSQYSIIIILYKDGKHATSVEYTNSIDVKTENITIYKIQLLK